MRNEASFSMASENQKHLDEENAKYAASFDKGDLPIPPAKKYLIGTTETSIPPTSSAILRLTQHQ